MIDSQAMVILSFLHSVLVYQHIYGQYSGYCHWSLADLSMIIDQMKSMDWNLMSYGSDVSEAVAHVYSGQCMNPTDASRVSALCHRLFRTICSVSEVTQVTSDAEYSLNSLFASCFVLQSSPVD
jgi:hypothetical protein